MRLNQAVGIFLTSNPGYGGRTELPDSLKTLFRPISMLTPETQLIAEISLFSEGFLTAKQMSRKCDLFSRLAMEQLSHQRHYDFGLRSLTAILHRAGQLRLEMLDVSEDAIILHAIKDVALPKLLSSDVECFNRVLLAVFPNTESLPSPRSPALQQALLLNTPSSLLKSTWNLYDTLCIRHGIILLGPSGSGKTTCWRSLFNSLTQCGSATTIGYLNPSSFSPGELYGHQRDGEWENGILPMVLKGDPSVDEAGDRWMVLDSVLSEEWVESMNSVFDDNRLLTLTNGERLPLPARTWIIMETDSMEFASPATVSRCGVVYLEVDAEAWRHIINTWLSDFETNIRKSSTDGEINGNGANGAISTLVDSIRKLVAKYVPQSLQFRRDIGSSMTSESCMVKQLTCVFDGSFVLSEYAQCENSDAQLKLVEMWFVFGIVWSLGCNMANEARKEFDMFVRSIDGMFPSRDLVYDYCVDGVKLQWIPWTDLVPTAWSHVPSTPLSQIVLPTPEAVRCCYLTRMLLLKKKHVLVHGQSSIGRVAVGGVTFRFSCDAALIFCVC